MLKKIDAVKVEGEGFSFERLNLYSAKYSEEDKFILLSLEPVFVKAKYDTIVMFEKPKWGEKFSLDYLNEEEKSVVKDRIESSLKLLGSNPIFDEGKGFDVEVIPEKKYKNTTNNTQKVIQVIVILLFLGLVIYFLKLLF